MPLLSAACPISCDDLPRLCLSLIGCDHDVQVSEDQWDKIFENNVKAGMFLAKEAYPHLSQSKYGGSIVYISSVSSKYEYVVHCCGVHHHCCWAMLFGPGQRPG